MVKDAKYEEVLSLLKANKEKIDSLKGEELTTQDGEALRREIISFNSIMDNIKRYRDEGLKDREEEPRM